MVPRGKVGRPLSQRLSGTQRSGCRASVGCMAEHGGPPAVTCYGTPLPTTLSGAAPGRPVPQ